MNYEDSRPGDERVGNRKKEMALRWMRLSRWLNYRQPTGPCACSSYATRAGGEAEESHDAMPPRKKKLKKRISKEASAVSPDGDNLLIKALKKQLSEVSYLHDRYQKAVVGSVRPFEMVPNEEDPSEGVADLTLRRQMGNEVVLVKCFLDMERPVEDENDNSADDDEMNGNEECLDMTQCLTMNIQVSKVSLKDHPKVLFLCSYTRGEKVIIEDIAYLGHSVHDDNLYSGPVYPDLSGSLKQAFHDVVKARGINSSLAETIIDHLTIRYGDEYVEWLQKVRAFLKK